jgi:hypothetical protein
MGTIRTIHGFIVQNHVQGTKPCAKVRTMENSAASVKLPSAKDAEKALTPQERIFGFTIQNIPTINLRQQYSCDRGIVFEAELPKTIHAWRFGLGGQRATVTYGDPDVFFSNMIRTTVFGIESVIRGAVWEELAFTNRMTETVMRSMREERAKSMVELYYERLPGYINKSARLKEFDAKLWPTVRAFYTEIRNPLSHGNQLTNVKQESLRGAFEMFDRIYTWIDSWSDPNRIMRILASTTFEALK